MREFIIDFSKSLKLRKETGNVLKRQKPDHGEEKTAVH